MGCEVDIVANVFPINSIVTYDWAATDSSFENPGTADFSTFPPGTTTYSVTVTDGVGCIATDDKTIFSDDERPIFIPNAFSPNNDGINDYFTVFANKATSEIASIQVFDRWGAKVFERKSIDANRVTEGWDGTFMGEVLNPGIYAYVIEVRFVDGVTQTYHGDLSLLK